MNESSSSSNVSYVDRMLASFSASSDVGLSYTSPRVGFGHEWSTSKSELDETTWAAHVPRQSRGVPGLEAAMQWAHFLEETRDSGPPAPEQHWVKLSTPDTKPPSGPFHSTPRRSRFSQDPTPLSFSGSETSIEEYGSDTGAAMFEGMTGLRDSSSFSDHGASLSQQHINDSTDRRERDEIPGIQRSARFSARPSSAQANDDSDDVDLATLALEIFNRHDLGRYTDSSQTGTEDAIPRRHSDTASCVDSDAVGWVSEAEVAEIEAYRPPSAVQTDHFIETSGFTRHSVERSTETSENPDTTYIAEDTGRSVTVQLHRDEDESHLDVHPARGDHRADPGPEMSRPSCSPNLDNAPHEPISPPLPEHSDVQVDGRLGEDGVSAQISSEAPSEKTVRRLKRGPLNTAVPISHAEWLARKLSDERREAESRAREKQSVAPWWPAGKSRAKANGTNSLDSKPNRKNSEGADRHEMGVHQRRQQADQAFTEWLRKREQRHAAQERARAADAETKAAEERSKRRNANDQSSKAYRDWLAKKNSDSAKHEMEQAARKAAQEKEERRRKDLAQEAYARWKRAAPTRPPASTTTWINPNPWIPIEVPPHDPEECTDVGPPAVRKSKGTTKRPQKKHGRSAKKHPSPPLLFRMHDIGIQQR